MMILNFSKSINSCFRVFLHELIMYKESFKGRNKKIIMIFDFIIVNVNLYGYGNFFSFIFRIIKIYLQLKIINNISYDITLKK